MSNDQHRRAEFLLRLVNASTEYRRVLKEFEALIESSDGLKFNFVDGDDGDFNDRLTAHLTPRTVADAVEAARKVLAADKNNRHNVIFLKVATPDA